MCGNGGRCAADFAIRSGIAGKKHTFKAIDGIHDAVSEDGLIRLKMNNVNELQSCQWKLFHQYRIASLCDFHEEC